MTTISSMALTSAPRLAIDQAQASLSKMQIELSSGQLADIGLGLGGTTSRFLSLEHQNGTLKAFTSSNAQISTQLNATTSALDAIRATASTFLSSLASSATVGSISGTLVTSATSNLGALTATLNTTVAGQAIFGGINSGTVPMTAYTTGSPAQTAVYGAFSSAFGTTPDSASASGITGTQMAGFLSGSFAGLFDSATYSSDWSSASDTVTSATIAPNETVQTSLSANATPFRQLAQAYTMMQEFGGSNFSLDAGQAVVAAATGLVSSAIEGLTTLEAGVGQSQNAVNDANTRIASQMTYLSSESSNLVSVDPTALSTQITSIQTQIQASYEITSQLQQLSLVNYLK